LQAVLEEVFSPQQYGVRNPRKERYLSGIITPAQPTYAYGKIDQRGDAAQDLALTAPICAVSSSVNGYKVHSSLAESNSIKQVREEICVWDFSKAGVVHEKGVGKKSGQTGHSLFVLAGRYSFCPGS
jgi:hypothetical protein